MRDLKQTGFTDRLTAQQEAKKALLARFKPKAAAPDPEFVGFDAGPQVVRDTRAKELRQEHRELQALRDAMKALGTDAEALLVQGPTVDTLFMEAARLHADLLVMGSHGRGGLYKALTGSVSGSALKRSTTPIVIVPPTERD